MTPENTRTSTNDEQTTPKDIRIPTIVEQRLQGTPWGQIANNLQINPKTLYDIRQKEDFDNYINQIVPIYDKAIRELINSDHENIRIAAANEYGRMIRAGIPKQIHQRTEKAEIKIVLHEYTQPPTNP